MQLVVIQENLIHILENPYPFSHYVGTEFCHGLNYITIMGYIQGVTGGTGIALMRMLFVVFPSRVYLGQKATAVAIALTTTGASAIGGYLIATNPLRMR